jgi:glycosyltransferase involved in cell wall biosynthesis
MIEKVHAPKISIVLPSYNRANYLAKAIESCLAQTFKDFELIIVDDCSTDNSLAIAKTYASKDPRIHLIKNDINKKLPASLNIGFALAKGNYLTWTSDDNLYHENALEKMTSCLDSMEDIGLVYADYTLIDENGNIGKRIYQESPEFLPIRDCVGPCFLYRADIARRVGEYNESMFLIEDYEYWLRFGLTAKLFHIKESLYFYRTHQSSLTKTRKDAIKKMKNKLKEIYSSKYSIPKQHKSIYDLYMWFIGDRRFLSYLKLLKIITLNPINTITYILKNLRRL